MTNLKNLWNEHEKKLWETPELKGFGYGKWMSKRFVFKDGIPAEGGGYHPANENRGGYNKEVVLEPSMTWHIVVPGTPASHGTVAILIEP